MNNLTIEEINDLINKIIDLPVERNNYCISSYGSIGINDLINIIKEFKKVPTYEELLKENKKLKEKLNK